MCIYYSSGKESPTSKKLKWMPAKNEFAVLPRNPNHKNDANSEDTLYI